MGPGCKAGARQLDAVLQVDGGQAGHSRHGGQPNVRQRAAALQKHPISISHLEPAASPVMIRESFAP